MQSPFYFIVNPKNNKRYDNTKDIGGLDFITSTSTEDHKFSNRYATVVSVPINYKGKIEKGDTLLVHHNVFKYYYDMRGRERSGKSFIKDNMYFVDEDQFYLYKKPSDKEWHTHSKYCFVEPILTEDYYIDKYTTEEPLMGKIRYINEDLLNLGLKVGDKICYEPHSDCEFMVDGEKLYRMYTNNIAVLME